MVAAGNQIDSLVGHEAQLCLDVPGPVAADRDVRQLHPQLEQAVGEPGPVAVAHAPREHLRAGHADSRPRAHRALTRRASRRGGATGCASG